MSADVEMDFRQLPLSEQNGLDAPSPYRDMVEEVADYRPGLHHPINLGEYIGVCRQYRVLTKLAVGKNSLVWMCRNIRKKPTPYVAIKIRNAHLSHGNRLKEEREMTWHLQNLAKDDPSIAKYCMLPIDEFEIEGPNGTHQCLVYPAAGPQLLEINKKVKGDPVKFLRKLAYQAAEAMAALHRHGICHRDFGPHKLLLRQDSLTGKSKRKALKYLEVGARMKIRIVYNTEGCGLPRSHAPDYIVRPIQYDEIEDDEPKRTKFTSSNICLIDFGESFTLPNQPPNGEVSGGYCAPEVLLESSSKAGMASDIWSLAYTIYEIRTGERLSDERSTDVEDHLVPMVEKLGPLPEPWWSTTWKSRRNYFKDRVDDDGMAIPTKNWSGQIGNEVVSEGDDSDEYDSNEDDSSEDDSSEDDSSEDDSSEDDSSEDDSDEDDIDEDDFGWGDKCYISDATDSETEGEESNSDDSDDNDETDFVFPTKEDWLTSQGGGNDSDKSKPVNDGSNEHKLDSPSKSPSPLQWTLDFSGVRHFLRRSDGKPWRGKVSGVEAHLLVDLLSMMLKYDPNERPTAEQVLKHPWFSFGMKKNAK